MKKIFLFVLAGAIAPMTGCDVESAMDKDLYPEQVYIVGAENTIIDRDLDIGVAEDVVSVAVAVSGSRPTTQDVTVTVGVHPEAVAAYNARELTSEDVHYRDLDENIYYFPSDRTTIRAGAIYNTFPIRIQPATLHCDSCYMLALHLTKTTAYALNREDTVALVRINLVNKFSDLYYMDGHITTPAANPADEDDVATYNMPRNLMATDDGNTVRMYHFSNETFEKDTDYRSNNTFKITVNADNSLTLVTWDKFNLIEGGGEWVEEWQTYKIWYRYDDNGTVRRTEGFLYRAPETDDELRRVQDWIEQERANG